MSSELGISWAGASDCPEAPAGAFIGSTPASPLALRQLADIPTCSARLDCYANLGTDAVDARCVRHEADGVGTAVYLDVIAFMRNGGKLHSRANSGGLLVLPEGNISVNHRFLAPEIVRPQAQSSSAAVRQRADPGQPVLRTLETIQTRFSNHLLRLAATSRAKAAGS